MYLKSIEIQGFKSFANKLRFEFHNGITAIVGPNGSGKSNVADAVRWVLGEQRVKQLRGSSMQDVIFAGTEHRKPLGFAYVAITLDNSDRGLPIDYGEVTVARRIYRSGESEYLMNGATCRLRDIQELFYDTGIGKEGYSIIGQGQIEKILSDKPEDRRELFDEAAGIVKFKRRKETSLKKLNSERDNLVRINDILQELERQVPSLEKQSEKAKIYLKTREELRTLDVNAFLLENEASMKQLEELEGKESIARADLQTQTARQDEVKAEAEVVSAELAEAEKQIEELRGKITSASVIRSRLEGDSKVLEEQIRGAQQNEEHFRDRQAAIGAQIRAREEEQAAILEKKTSIDGTAASLIAAKEKASAVLAETEEKIRETGGQLDSGREKILEIVSARATIKSRLAMLETKAQQLETQKQDNRRRLDELSTSGTEHEERIAQLREQFAQISAQITEDQKRQKEVEQEIGSIKGILSSEDEKLRAAQLQYHQDRSKLDALINLAERYEGFGGSVRRVMSCRKSEPGLIGVVADLFKTEKKYETAIETALGGSIQNIVTEDEGTAKRMIGLLKREKAGRATFLPLTSLRGSQELKQKEILREPGVIGLADSLVRTDEKYRPVAESLLGRIVIVDNFDHAAAAGRKYRQGVRMVTLDGELFAPGGAISGGAFKNSSNLLGRRREMDELRRKVAADEEEARSHEQAIEDTKARRNGLRTELEQLRQSLQTAVLRQNTARLSIRAEQEKQREAAGSAEQLQQESETIERQIRETLSDRLKGAQELQTSEQQEQELSAATAQLEETLAQLRQQETEQASEAGSWDVEITKASQQQRFEQQNLERVEEELARFRGELAEITAGIEESVRDREERAERLATLRERIETSFSVQDDGKKELEELTDRRSELGGRQKEILRERESLADTVAALDKECFRLATRRERLQESVDSQVAYMWEEYELTLSQTRALRDESLSDLPALRKEIAGKKAAIRDLGSVNVNAIEEYKELMERYTFLKAQHDDLIQAAETLEKIIAELDDAMRKQFREQFDRIMQEFDKVFKIMFGGGVGRLELMEDTDILEAGVRVIAQPPGKKLQNMMQLSGGEKSLTAIALLFAIQNLKPSPFCLLDEIEAALDENNVNRFAGYLHKLTEHTQFIVITHRRGTMEEADRLYGITMQEKGVSTLVSVDLIDKELDA